MQVSETQHASYLVAASAAPDMQGEKQGEEKKTRDSDNTHQASRGLSSFNLKKKKENRT